MDTNTVLAIGKDIRFRKEGDLYILINISTQGLHFVSKTAYDFVSAFNGAKSVNQVIEERFDNISEEQRTVVLKFIEDLVERKVLKAS